MLDLLAPSSLELLRDALETADIGATVLELAGCAEALGHGRSLVPLLDGRPLGERPVMAFARRTDDAPDFDIDAVRTRELKLIRRAREGAAQLFDVRGDPAEQYDAAAARPADVAGLQAVLDRDRAALRATDSSAPPLAIDATTREQLRALGYLPDGA